MFYKHSHKVNLIVEYILINIEIIYKYRLILEEKRKVLYANI